MSLIRSAYSLNETSYEYPSAMEIKNQKLNWYLMTISFCHLQRGDSTRLGRRRRRTGGGMAGNGRIPRTILDS